MDQADVVSPFASLCDLSKIAIFGVSVLLIIHASRRVVLLEKEEKNSAEYSVHTLSCRDVTCFPIAGSFSLLLFFYCFDSIQYVFTLCVSVVSTVAGYTLFMPYTTMLCQPFEEQRKHIGHCGHLLGGEATAVFIAVLLTFSWLYTGHWLLLDVLGVSLCVMMLQFFRLPNLRLSAILLCVLVIYDVFWVFFSSSVFESNVMVAVATKVADNPVAMVADKLNLPGAAKTRPPLSIPGKLIFPSSIHSGHFSMLGLGDIILPGLLLCFAMRYDHAVMRATMATDRISLACSKWSYFQISICGYALGLIFAAVAAEMFSSPQPALLYLVPCTLIPFVVKATIQGDLKSLWDGPFDQLQTKISTPTPV
ncbi:signal peptide peptidase-like 3 [Dysidea avara]|uniref:signal peptide peptidase-like 3 n=1 Tax=Dysidea avara TaxID=196820 RepID=UPI003331BC8D